MRKRAKVSWQPSGVVKKRLGSLANLCGFIHLELNRVFCVKSTGAKTRAHARIWGLGRIWQESLGLEPAYVIEVVSEKFNRLNKAEQDQVLLHELLHIPKNFSGALVPHKRRGGVNERRVKELYAALVKQKQNLIAQ